MATFQDSLLLLEAIGVVGLLVGAWLGLLAVRARFSGWSSLATRYRARERPEGREFPRQWAKFNGWSFPRAVTVHASSRGLFLELTRPWRFRHPPLLIPWTRISGPRPDTTTLLGHRRLELILSERPVCVVRLDEAAALEARQYLPVPHMPYAPPPRYVPPPPGDADVPSRPRESPRAPAAPYGRGGPPPAILLASDQWLVTCICGWTARAPSNVAADAAVIVHQREAAGSEHVMACARVAGVRQEQEPAPPARQGPEEPLPMTRPWPSPVPSSGQSSAGGTRPARGSGKRRRARSA